MQRQGEAGRLDESPYLADPFIEQHDKLQLEQHDRIAAQPAPRRVELSSPTPNGTEVEPRPVVAVEVVGRAQVLQRNGDRLIEVVALCGAEHGLLRARVDFRNGPQSPFRL